MSWFWGSSSGSSSSDQDARSSSEHLLKEEISYTDVFAPDSSGTTHPSSSGTDPSAMGSAFFDQEVFSSQSGNGAFYAGANEGPSLGSDTSSSSSSFMSSDPFPSSSGSTSSFETSSRSPRVDFGAVGSIKPGTVAPAIGIYGHGMGKPAGVDYVFAEDYKEMRKKSGTEQLVYLAGASYLCGSAIGGALGLREGIVSSAGKSSKLRLNAVLNATAKRGVSTGNSLGVLALFFCLGESAVYNYTCDDKAVNYAAAGFAAGALFKSTRGLRMAGLWGAAGAATALATVYASREGFYGRRVQGML